MRIPVHKPLAAIDEALVVEIDKNLDHRVVEVAFLTLGGVRRTGHGEGLAGPVGRGTEALELTDDRAARFLLLFPDAQGKGVAPHVTAGRLPVRGHLALRDHLRGNARVVGARLPERVKAPHPVPAHHDILKRVVEGVAHMQAAGDVRRRDHHAERVLARLGIGTGAEGTGLFPGCGNAGFCRACIKGLFHGHDIPFCLPPPLAKSAPKGKVAWGISWASEAARRPGGRDRVFTTRKKQGRSAPFRRRPRLWRCYDGQGRLLPRAVIGSPACTAA